MFANTHTLMEVEINLQELFLLGIEYNVQICMEIFL